MTESHFWLLCILIATCTGFIATTLNRLIKLGEDIRDRLASIAESTSSIDSLPWSVVQAFKRANEDAGPPFP